MSFFKSDELIRNTKHIIEANSFETTILWEKFSKDNIWRQNHCGSSITLGDLNNKPVVISLSWNLINGDWFVFFEPTSQVVDYEMIESYFKENFNFITRTNAQNFHTAIHNTRSKQKDSSFSRFNINIKEFTNLVFENPYKTENEIIDLMKFNLD